MTLAKAPVVTLQALVQDFFEKCLTVERSVKRHTVLSYRDCLKLFLRHAAERFECTVDQLDHAVLDAEVVRSFLGWLERKRKCGARTRNQRLAAIKSFARYVASVAPEHWDRWRGIHELRPARFQQPEIEYLDDA
ncbi:MAG: site-specific integrase, partial [bacterium]|nr:site-specific integrase [bacterium]